MVLGVWRVVGSRGIGSVSGQVKCLGNGFTNLYMVGMRLWGDACAQWTAAQAFAFVAGVLWFASFVVGLLVWARRDRGTVAEGTVPAAAPAG
jgi:hypothetical protein